MLRPRHGNRATPAPKREIVAISIAVSPDDNNSAGNGTTQFTRIYDDATSVTLTASATAGGNNFDKWTRDGVDFSTELAATVTMDADYTFTAVYVTPAVTHTLTVASSNPSTGVPITVNPADNDATHWNLAKAAGDPLFGLPELPDLDPPASPFLGLHWFERRHARVFFGRGAEIRQLYDAVTDEDGAPIILFYGQSGVGKSSILDAGLLPRLEGDHRVRYLRRDKEHGLLGTLKSAFRETGDDLLAAWRVAEDDEPHRPLLIVLDQVEELLA